MCVISSRPHVSLGTPLFDPSHYSHLSDSPSIHPIVRPTVHPSVPLPYTVDVVYTRKYGGAHNLTINIVRGLIFC